MNESQNSNLTGKTCQYNEYKHNVPISDRDVDKLCGEPATSIYEGKTAAFYLCEAHQKIVTDRFGGGCMI